MAEIDLARVSFPGGKKVAVELDGHVVMTDQRPPSGEGSAPEPLSLFVASIAACAGAYAQGFCHARGLSMDGMELVMKSEWNPELHRYTRMDIELKVPPDFPEKYHKAIVRAMNMCTVKRCILTPPEFTVRIVES